MTTRDSKLKSKPRSPGSTRDKGDLVEDVAALLYECDEYTIAKRVEFPLPDDPTETREFDVLISRPLAGKEMHVAIECKNYKEPIDIEKIDAFIAKLEDVRIPPQNGIFICVNGYQKGALRRANKAGIQALVLDGLTPDRMKVQVHEAFQSVVYLLLNVARITVTSEVGHGEAWMLPWFKDNQGRFCGGILDLVWTKWRNRELPTELGEYEVSVDLPSGWHWWVGNKTVPNNATVTVQVIGLVVTETGRAERFTLSDPETGMLERAKLQSAFDIGDSGPRALPVEAAFSETELDRLLAKPATVTVSVGRLPLPRIHYGPMYWPPSQRTADFISGQFEARLKESLQRWWLFGETPDESYLFPAKGLGMDLGVVEGSDLRAVWEPILPSHPAAKDPHWPFSQRTRRLPNQAKQPRRPRRSTVRRSARSPAHLR